MDNPLAGILEQVKRVPMWTWVGAGIATLAIGAGFYQQAKKGRTQNSQDLQIPYADTTSPLDYLYQDTSGLATAPGVSTVNNASPAPVTSPVTAPVFPGAGRLPGTGYTPPVPGGRYPVTHLDLINQAHSSYIH